MILTVIHFFVVTETFKLLAGVKLPLIIFCCTRWLNLTADSNLKVF